MIKVSHEVPIPMLERSLAWNDYQYALVHLFEEHPNYLAFYKECLRKGVKVLLDNSVFELGFAFNTGKFVEWVKELQPTEFIIPDVLDDSDATMNEAALFLGNNPSLHSSAIGVVHGETYEEFIECYRFFDKELNLNKIAIPFTSKFFPETFPHPNKYLSKSLGRVNVLSRMLKDSVVNTNKKHHLLGCYLPIEFSFYDKDFSWIETLDTSSPIVHGLKGIEYSELGIMKKNESKLVDFISTNPTEEQIALIEKNVISFKKLLIQH